LKFGTVEIGSLLGLLVELQNGVKFSGRLITDTAATNG
jgi:hypothetical protein